jgi:hypothetical protein
VEDIVDIYQATDVEAQNSRPDADGEEAGRPDGHRLTPDADDPETDEAGYGYGV